MKTRAKDIMPMYVYVLESVNRIYNETLQRSKLYTVIEEEAIPPEFVSSWIKFCSDFSSVKNKKQLEVFSQNVVDNTFEVIELFCKGRKAHMVLSIEDNDHELLTKIEFIS